MTEKQRDEPEVLRVWYCKIGESDLPTGAPNDPPMRDAVERAYERITGKPADFTFSGWGADLTEAERAVIENRMPDRGKQTVDALAHLELVSGQKWSPRDADKGGSVRDG